MCWLKKKSLFWSIIFSYSTQQQSISQLDCDVQWKVDFIQRPAMTSSVAGQRRNSKALPKAKLAPENGHSHCLVVCCPSDPHSFLNPGETVTSEKYGQKINEMHWKLQCLQPALVDRNGPVFLQDNAWLHSRTTNASKVEWIGLWSFASSVMSHQASR